MPSRHDHVQCEDPLTGGTADQLVYQALPLPDTLAVVRAQPLQPMRQAVPVHRAQPNGVVALTVAAVVVATAVGR